MVLAREHAGLHGNAGEEAEDEGQDEEQERMLCGQEGHVNLSATWWKAVEMVQVLGRWLIQWG